MAEILPNELLSLLATPQAPLLIDVCTPEDHALDPRVLPGARRQLHLDRVQTDGPAVFICQKGLKLSQGAAALHAAGGHTAWYLSGGMYAWAAAGLPLIKGDTPQRWVVPDTANVALVHWIAARLLPGGAEVLPIAPQAAVQVAEKFNACFVAGAAEMLDRLALDWQRTDHMIEAAARYEPLLRAATRAQALCILDAAFAAQTEAAA